MKTIRWGSWVFVVGCVVGAVLVLSGEAAIERRAQRPAVECAPAPGGGTRHLAISGRPVLLKAVVAPRPGRLLRFELDFGDGSDPLAGVLEHANLWASHAYPERPVGTRFEARVRVTDVASGEVALAIYPVEVVEPTVENKTAVALDDALWRLHITQRRSEHPLHGSLGSWNSEHFPLGSTAMAALAFEVNGFDRRAERQDTPYADTAARARRYLLSSLCLTRATPRAAREGVAPVTSDANGNGFAISVAGDYVNYEVPLIAMALIASQDREAVADAGGEGVHGRRYEDLVRDMLETLWNSEQRRIPGAGGWRYRVNDRAADLSVSQFPALAISAAHEVWGIDSPAEVERELREGFLRSMQDGSGGFGYRRGRAQPTVPMTGAGMIALACADVAPDDPRVLRASDWLGSYWEPESSTGYDLYALMKAAKLNGIERFGDRDWRAEGVAAVYGTQRGDGSWKPETYGVGVNATTWRALFLSKDVFATSRPARLRWQPIALAAGFGGAWLLLIVVAVRFWRGLPTRVVCLSGGGVS